MYTGLSGKQTRAWSQPTTQKLPELATLFDCSVQDRQNSPSFTELREDILKFIREFGERLEYELQLI